MGGGALGSMRVYGLLEALGSKEARLSIPAGFLHISAGFLLKRFQMKERRFFCLCAEQTGPKISFLL
jgi:hypothetical protein